MPPPIKDEWIEPCDFRSFSGSADVVSDAGISVIRPSAMRRRRSVLRSAPLTGARKCLSRPAGQKYGLREVGRPK